MNCLRVANQKKTSSETMSKLAFRGLNDSLQIPIGKDFLRSVRPDAGPEYKSPEDPTERTFEIVQINEATEPSL